MSPYLRPEPRPLPDLDDRRKPPGLDIAWSLLITALGLALLITTPPLGVTPITLVGIAGFVAGGVWFSHLIHRKANP